MRDRPGLRADSLPVPWEAGASFESREMAVFFLSAFFLAVVCVFAQAARSFESKDTIYALIARIRDVVDGEGDLTKRLSLRDTDEFGELGEAVNRITSYNVCYTKLLRRFPARWTRRGGLTSCSCSARNNFV